MSLASMVTESGVGIGEIASYLDGLSFDDCAEQSFTLTRAGQRALYEKAADAPPITLEHFVPSDRADLAEVIHHGRNTLPLPSPFRLFQKRFCRPGQDADGRLFGYNEGRARGFIGPGCFVAIPTAGRDAAWIERGPVVVDYFQVPDSAVCPDWPEVVPNTRGLQFFVYNKTRDFMRKVSEHVSIGAAYKVEKSLGQFFILVRED